MALSLKAVVKNNLIATNYFHVKESMSEGGNPMFILTRRVSGRPVTIHLEVVKGGLWVNPPKYTFVSTISHFDFIEQETRWTRRKDIIMNVVAMLMKAEIWPFILNKKFFSVNKNCRAFQKKKGLRSRVMDEFHATLDPKKRVTRNPKQMAELRKKADQLLAKNKNK